jgi:hypothetical protein
LKKRLKNQERGCRERFDTFYAGSLKALAGKKNYYLEMDIERFSLPVHGFDHEATFHFCRSHDHYEVYVIFYNRLSCFDIIMGNGNREF